jgi:hypothetical protein
LMRAPPGEPRLGGRGALASTPKVALRCGSLVTLGPTLISRCSPTPLGFRGVSCTPGFAGPCAGRPLCLGNLGSQKLPPPTFHDVAVRGAGRGERFLAPPLADSGSPLRPGAASLSLEGTSGEPRVVTLGRRLPSVPSPSPGQASVKGSLSGGFTHLTESRWCFKEQFRCYLGRPARPVRLASALASPPQPPLADPLGCRAPYVQVPCQAPAHGGKPLFPTPHV